jgi:hypothetical protein
MRFNKYILFLNLILIGCSGSNNLNQNRVGKNIIINGTNGTYSYNIADDGYYVAFRDLKGETINCKTRARNALDGVLLGPDTYGETNINSDHYAIKLLNDDTSRILVCRLYEPSYSSGSGYAYIPLTDTESTSVFDGTGITSAFDEPKPSPSPLVPGVNGLIYDNGQHDIDTSIAITNYNLRTLHCSNNNC